MNATAPLSTKSRRLYVPPSVLQFHKDGRDKLLAALRTLDNSTTLNGVQGPEELQLVSDTSECHTLRGYYQYTSHGFRQVASRLGPGVSRLLPDLAGTRRRDLSDTMLDAAMAVRWFNALVDLRFSVFSAYRVVRNTSTKMIDGLIGNTHQYLENVGLFELTAEAVENNQSPATFYAGVLIGRRLAMWWRESNPLCTFPIAGRNVSIYRGYYFCNGESAGLSVKVAMCLFTPWGICLGPYKSHGARVQHRGKDFMLRVGAAVQHVLTLTLPRDEWQEAIPRALNRSLGFDMARELKARKHQQRLLTAALHNVGVDYSLAGEIVQNAMQFGRDVGRTTDPIYQLDKLYASRTGLDLLASLLYSARRLDINRRERLEQAAFNLLTDKFF